MARDEAVSKPYELFFQALRETEYDAIAKVTMHNREHAVVIRAAESGMMMHTLFYPNELRAVNSAENQNGQEGVP